MKAGRLVILKQFPYVAVPFFRRGVVGNKDAARNCGDEQLKRSVQAALSGLPGDDPLVAEARQVQSVCRK